MPFFYFYIMQETSFLSKLSQIIIDDYSESILDLVIILPNKRAKVFLIEQLNLKAKKNIFCPEILTIEDFTQNIAGIRLIDNVELLFTFYNIYLSITEKSKQETFENFANWAKTLIQDFNEIDRYLLDPEKILKYLDNIKEIEHWSVDAENKTTIIEKYLLFWKLLPSYYKVFYEHLLKNNSGYQGLIYREAVEKLGLFSSLNPEKYYVFAGFNALNKAEEKIIQFLLSINKAKIYWDADETFFNDYYHDASLFVRKFKKEWPYYKSNPFEWITNEYKENKNIQIYGTSKSIGQAKIIGNIIENYNDDLNKVAIVLGDETLLLPVLNSLPDTINSLNITMGYSSTNNPVQVLVEKLFKMHINAIKRNSSSYVFYYKDVLDILNHSLIEPYVKTKKLVHIINSNNFTFITHKKIVELMEMKNTFFDKLFQKWEVSSLEILEIISEILLLIKSNLNKENEDEKLTNAFVYSIFKVINKLITYYTNNENINDLQTLHTIYKQVISVAEVSFEGEPLNGLQIMGVLESRVLDFETVIITSVNEGKFPAGKGMNSFIPNDVKREYELPTYKEKDAIYTYHFYHLLQRAKNIYLIYNTDAEAFDSGEKSRFITQLLVEKQKNHTITQQIYNAEVPNEANQKTVIPKSEKVLLRLKEICETGFSPSSLTAYIRNPIQFYLQRVLRLSKVDEVEENIALNTLGTIIHEVLEVLYTPLIGKILTEKDIENCVDKIDDEVYKQFKIVYKEGDIKKGRNLLAFEVAKRNILKFLKLEIETIKNGDEIQILALEKDCSKTINHPKLPFPVLIKGKVDRIEIRNKNLRIIDYKTGKVLKNDLVLKYWDGLTLNIKNEKIIQLLAYAFMIENDFDFQNIETGVISFKNLKSGFLPFIFKDNKNDISFISREILDTYVDEIVVLLSEILDETIPFEEKN